MKRELLNIEGGKIKKGNNVIFDDLSLELFQGEITGIVFDDILEQKLFIDMLLGDILLYSLFLSFRLLYSVILFSLISLLPVCNDRYRYPDFCSKIRNTINMYSIFIPK